MRKRYALALMLAALMSVQPPGRADVVLVSDGQARATIVVPRNALPVVLYAAAELKYHVKRATGIELSIAQEGKEPEQPAARIYLGGCEAARKAGLTVDQAPESFVIKTIAGHLYIVGGDSEGSSLLSSTQGGTLFGVYELLEDVMGVRWLWPGKLGEVVPKTETVVVPSGEKRWQPPMLWRGLRTTLRGSFAKGAYSRTAFGQVRNDERVWLRRHRMGRSIKISYGHAFTKWWDKYGESHPEYFNQLPDGQRRPHRAPTVVSMCVSEPKLWQQIVDNWWEARAKGGPRNVNVSENDVSGLCTCPRCLKWDEPLLPKPASKRYMGPEPGCRVVSNRYARFYRAVQELASKRDLDVVAAGYAYVNYFPAPSPEVRLNDHIFVGLVPDTFFPRTKEDQKWVLEQWEGWARTGARLFLRPNYFLDGYCLPYIFVHQFADEFGHAARHGMVATDFDSLTGMWAAQGPNLYALGRLHVRPRAAVDTVLREYYSAFGPAAEPVKAYFAYWEQVTKDRHPARVEAQLGWSSFPRGVHKVYTPALFAKGRALLDAAVTVAKPDPLASARVEFLAKGLEHARLCVETSRRLAETKESGNLLASLTAIRQLNDYRRSIERDNVANLAFCNRIEHRVWDRGLAEEMRGKGVIAQLPIEWRMKWDTEELGQAQQWYDPTVDASAWLPVRTDAAWEKQAVGEKWKAEHGKDYDGLAWYRTSFTVAPTLRGRKLSLVFGAVDETATVWLNGRLAGSHPFKRPEDWYMPFTIDITNHVQFDGPNVVVVLVEDRAGLGGVWKPVILVSE